MTYMRMETSSMLTHLFLDPPPPAREYVLRTPTGQVLDTRTMPGTEAADRNAAAEALGVDDGARWMLATMEYPRPATAPSACRFEMVLEATTQPREGL